VTTTARHVPVRTCMGCGQRAPQPTLLRVSVAANGSLGVVRRAPQCGRCGYLHRRADCWLHFAARKGPIRSLRRSVDKTTRLAFVQGLEAMA
jgi:uncharacterized protein